MSRRKPTHLRICQIHLCFLCQIISHICMFHWHALATLSSQMTFNILCHINNFKNQDAADKCLKHNTHWSIDPFLVALHAMARVDHYKLPSIVNAAFVSANFTIRTQHPELKHSHSNLCWLGKSGVRGREWYGDRMSDLESKSSKGHGFDPQAERCLKKYLPSLSCLLCYV